MNNIRANEYNLEDDGPHDREYNSRSPDVLNESIENLDGDRKTYVCYYFTDEIYLTIAGGNVGRYVCYITEGDSIKNLVNDNDSDFHEVEIVAGGQPGIFNSKFCINKAAVIQAANYFYEHHTTDPRLSWEDQR